MKTKKKVKPVITLESMPGNPNCHIYPGHVDIKTFNKAVAVVWGKDMKYTDEEIRYRYYIPIKLKKGTRYKLVPGNTKGAKKFTWASWD